MALDLSWALDRERQKLDDGRIAAFVELFGAGFTAINLASCRLLTDATSQMLAARGATVTTLDLSGCHKLTDTGIAAVIAQCPKVVSVNVRGCQLGAATIDRIAGCRDLAEVRLGRCRLYQSIRQSADWLAKLATACLKLTALDLEQCMWVDDAGLAMHGNFDIIFGPKFARFSAPHDPTRAL